MLYVKLGSRTHDDLI